QRYLARAHDVETQEFLVELPRLVEVERLKRAVRQEFQLEDRLLGRFHWTFRHAVSPFVEAGVVPLREVDERTPSTILRWPSRRKRREGGLPMDYRLLTFRNSEGAAEAGVLFGDRIYRAAALLAGAGVDASSVLGLLRSW